MKDILKGDYHNGQQILQKTHLYHDSLYSKPDCLPLKNDLQPLSNLHFADSVSCSVKNNVILQSQWEWK